MAGLKIGLPRSKSDKKNRKNNYIVLMDLDFSWKKSEVSVAKSLWKKGYGIRDIAEELQREGDETFLLLLDLARKKLIKSRKGALFGYAKDN